jgi:hypothetical protein
LEIEVVITKGIHFSLNWFRKIFFNSEKYRFLINLCATKY